MFALLIGSGLSRAAGIPTGWEITLDLIRALAALNDTTESDDWAKWYKEKYNVDPSYSDILDKIASTPSERRSILHRYIEPAEGEDTRRPTKAHRAIAKLVQDGAIRVIITTNFDRLLENALREIGIEATIIASDDAISGAVPLIHSRCTIIKVHGDYLDSRIRNTDAELEGYSSEMNNLLDEVFDRFGLIVVGWSGEWDTALRAALMRAPSRRYPMYWAARGAVASSAADLVIHRGGRSFSISDADAFFSRLSDTVDALRSANRAHPSTVAMALALAKRYCRDDQFGLEWAELLANEAKKIRDYINGPQYPSAHPTPEILNDLVNAVVAKTETLRRICMLCARWGTVEASKAAIKTVRSLGMRGELRGGYTIYSEMRDLPASLCFYWLLAGSLARESWLRTAQILHEKIKRDDEFERFVDALNIYAIQSNNWKFLKGLENRKTPASDFLFALLEKEVPDINYNPQETEDLFNQLEFIITADFAHRRIRKVEEGTGPWFWAPLGRYMWRGRYTREMSSPIDLPNLRDDSPILKAGLFGGTSATAKKVALELDGFFKRNAGSFY
ncbi:SIR2 family protein [Methylobacterium sp. J-070]|uniref:SIR2 family protein n=1 Tax=Methylobacterium sp. J-070 TaxID=2836650 RepID=UPI001FBB2C64|nr:SIR2 family protein [Methylobacterium sp. J-070]MCJ2051246.1 SIR2 family protein [Methylobacterium sp. J-070]